MSKAEFLADASELVPLGEAAVAGVESVPEVMDQARTGTCAAAFPVF